MRSGKFTIKSLLLFVAIAALGVFLFFCIPVEAQIRYQRISADLSEGEQIAIGRVGDPEGNKIRCQLLKHYQFNNGFVLVKLSRIQSWDIDNLTMPHLT